MKNLTIFEVNSTEGYLTLPNGIHLTRPRENSKPCRPKPPHHSHKHPEEPVINGHRKTGRMDKATPPAQSMATCHAESREQRATGANHFSEAAAPNGRRPCRPPSRPARYWQNWAFVDQQYPPRDPARYWQNGLPVAQLPSRTKTEKAKTVDQKLTYPQKLPKLSP